MAIPMRLERVMLFVPANNRRMIEKAAASEADAVCLDLEDAVPLEEKAASRALAARAFQELDFGRRLRILRINGLDTGFAYRDVIEVVEAAGGRRRRNRFRGPAAHANRAEPPARATDRHRSPDRDRRRLFALRRHCGSLAAARSLDLRPRRLRRLDADAGLGHRGIR